MPTISGTALDPGRTELPDLYKEGMKEVAVEIKDLQDGTYWNGSSFTAYGAGSKFLADGTLNWSTTTLVNSGLKDGKSYEIFAKPKDKAGNENSSSYTVVFDTSLPNSGISYPRYMQMVRTMSTISGTASDPDGSNIPNYMSDLKQVEIQIYDILGTTYWDGSAFATYSSSFNIVSDFYVVSGTWTYTSSATRAIDKAGNVQAGFTDNVSSITFVVDKTPPQVDITQPIDNGKYKPSGLAGVDAINGTSSDALLPGATEQMNKVQVHLSYLQDNATYYWTGSVFSSWTVTFDEAWKTVNGTAPWNYSFNEGNWISDKKYTLRARAFDKAEPFATANGGNESAWKTYTVIVDSTPPTSLVSTPSAGGYISGAGLSAISGTSNSNLSGIQTDGLKLRVSYVYGTDTWYWYGTSWSSPTPTNLSVDITGVAYSTWTYPPVGQSLPTISTHNQVYNFSIAGLDQAGNQETASAISVTSDFNYPVVTISTPMAGADAFYSQVRTVGSFAGNAADSPAGILAPLKTQISNISDTTKWNGSGWVIAGSTWLIVNNINPWDLNSPPWVDNKR
ncbi:MAG: hypothetical protein HY746_01075, partial [Elusimicrobia bacterium]|nr:hypothetical protein [Elusimicrobiota bacterium]